MDNLTCVLVDDEQEPDPAGIEALREAGDTESFQEVDPEGALSTMFSEDADIAVEIDGTPWVAQKIAAMRAYATQIAADGPFFAGRRSSATRVGPASITAWPSVSRFLRAKAGLTTCSPG